MAPHRCWHLRSGTVKSLAVLCRPLSDSWIAPPTAPRATICSIPTSGALAALRTRRLEACSTGCCRLACSAARKSLVCWGWIVLHAISSLVHWCCSCPGQGRAANPWWLSAAWVVWVQRFSSTSRLCDCPNSRGPAPHLRYCSSTLSPPPVSVSNTFLRHLPTSGPFIQAHLQTLNHFDTCDPSVLTLHLLATLPLSRAFPHYQYQSISRSGDTEATGLAPPQSFFHRKLQQHLSRAPSTGPSTSAVLSTSLQL